jgi:hypothetical protein
MLIHAVDLFLSSYRNALSLILASDTFEHLADADSSKRILRLLKQKDTSAVNIDPAPNVST